MSFPQQCRLVYSLNNRHYLADIIIEYDSYDPRLSEFVIEDILDLGSEEKAKEAILEVSSKPEYILRYTVPYNIGLEIYEDYIFRCDARAVNLKLKHKLYNKAQQFEYKDLVLSKFNWSSDAKKEKVEDRTVFHEYNDLRTFIEILPSFCRSIVNYITHHYG